MTDIAFSCGCGKVQLLATHVAPETGTRIRNTMGAGMAFIGLIQHAVADRSVRDENFGPVRGYVQTRSAAAKLAGNEKQPDVPFPLLLRILFKLMVWKLRGLNKPSSFFEDGQPVVKPFILNPKSRSTT